MNFSRFRPVVVLTALALHANVAGAAEREKAPKISPTVVPSLSLPDLSAANSSYNMTAQDLALDCKTITGRIQVRIRQLRGTMADNKTSAVARGLQQATTPLIGGTTRGIDPDGDNARDLGYLKAMNGRLAEKGCPTFDLAADLAPGNTAYPRPIKKVKPATAAPPSSALPISAKPATPPPADGMKPASRAPAPVSAPR